MFNVNHMLKPSESVKRVKEKSAPQLQTKHKFPGVILRT